MNWSNWIQRGQWLLRHTLSVYSEFNSLKAMKNVNLLRCSHLQKRRVYLWYVFFVSLSLWALLRLCCIDTVIFFSLLLLISNYTMTLFYSPFCTASGKKMEIVCQVYNIYINNVKLRLNFSTNSRKCWVNKCTMNKKKTATNQLKWAYILRFFQHFFFSSSSNPSCISIDF